MFRVSLDRLHHQVELVGAVDLAREAVIDIRRDLLGLGEVMQTIDSMCGIVSHEKHDARPVLRAGDESEMIGAEVEHVEEGSRKPSPHRQRR